MVNSQAALQRQNRTIIAINVIMVLAFMWYAQAFGTIEARKIVIKNEQGGGQIVLEIKQGDPLITLQDSRGRALAVDIPALYNTDISPSGANDRLLDSQTDKVRIHEGTILVGN